MNYTAKNFRDAQRLMNLAEAAADEDLINMPLVEHYHMMREELGLANLLLLIEEHVFQKTGK